MISLNKLRCIFKACLYLLCVYGISIIIIKHAYHPYLSTWIADLPKGSLTQFWLTINGMATIVRPFFFVWAILTFCFFTKVIDKTSVRESVLIPHVYHLKHLFVGSMIAAVMLGLVIILSLITHAISITFKADLFSWLGVLIPTFFILMFFTGFSEELNLRGYCLKQMAQQLNPHLAVLITGLLFGGLHIFGGDGSLLYVTQAAIIGFMLSYMFLITDSVYLVAGWHMTWNAIDAIFYSPHIAAVTVNKPWLQGVKLLDQTREGVISIPVTATALIVVFYYYQRLKKEGLAAL